MAMTPTDKRVDTLAPTSRARGTAPTLREVAARAGVSRATASRAINGGQHVSPSARAAVEAAVLELGFTPNQVARSLATKRTNSIALVIPEPNSRVQTDPFYNATVSGLTDAIEDTELQLIVIVAKPGRWTDRAAQYLTTGHVDGVVIASHHRDDTLHLQLVQAGLPVVFVGRPLDLVDGAFFVDADNVAGARLATSHLVAQGRRRIATIAGPNDMAAGLDRLVGWREVMSESGLKDDAVVVGDFTTAGGARAMARLLLEHPDLDAVFIANDLMAAGALSTLSSQGMLVPDDVAVVGFDDLGVGETTSPPLSTVTNPVAELTARAAGLVRHLIEMGGPDDTVANHLVAPRLILRASA